MPAREMHFTFNKDVKINEKTVAQFVDDYRGLIEDFFQEIKTEFEVDSINTDFLKKFIKELKSFDSVSIEDGESHGKQSIVKEFISDTVCMNEVKNPEDVLGIRYLYDEWDYDGCGYEDHYYLTYTDDVNMIKKTMKEAEKVIKKLKNLGVKAELKIEE